MLLWAVVVVEMLSPLPAFLSLGTVYVLLFRPPWLPAIVDELYGPTGGY
jgi:hypothetical protein